MKLTTKEIMETVKKAPPFHQKEIEASYVGRKVNWPLTFHKIEKLENGEFNVFSTDDWDELRNTGIFFSIEINKYPELKLLEEGSNIEVSGTIEEVLHGIVYLDNVSLKVIERKEAKKITEKAPNRTTKYSMDKRTDGILKQIILHKVWSSLIAFIILLIIYWATGLSPKDLIP